MLILVDHLGSQLKGGQLSYTSLSTTIICPVIHYSQSEGFHNPRDSLSKEILAYSLGLIEFLLNLLQFMLKEIDQILIGLHTIYISPNFPHCIVPHALDLLFSYVLILGFYLS